MNPDRDIIKMRYDFEFIEEDDSYILILNEEPHHIYPKENYSYLRAEIEASDTVNQARERHGSDVVYYDGLFSNFEKQTAL